MAYQEFTGELDAPEAPSAAPRYRAFEGELDNAGRGSVNPPLVRPAEEVAPPADAATSSAPAPARPTSRFGLGWSGTRISPDGGDDSVLDRPNPYPQPGPAFGRLDAVPRPPQPMPSSSRDSIKNTPPEVAAGQMIRSATGSSGAGAAAQGIASGFAGLGKVVPGLIAAGADLVGAHDTRDFALGAAQSAENFSQAVEPQGGYYNKLIGNVFSSTVQSLPTLAFGLGGGAEIVGGKAVADLAAKKAMSNAMRELFVQTAGQEYADARNNGAQPGESAARAAIFGAAEVLGERFGFHEQMAVIRAAVGKKAVPSHELGRVLATEVLKEIPGEELTTGLEFLADKYGPAAQNPKATLEDYFQQAADTAVQTIGQTGLMGAPASIRSATGDAYRRADASIAYGHARINGFHVDPPLTTDTPDTQRKKTLSIFDGLAAQVGMPKAAVDRAKGAVDGMAAADVGPFLRKLVGAYEARGLTARPVEPHVVDTLDAGPIEPPPEVEKKPTKAETKAPEVETAGAAAPAPANPKQAAVDNIAALFGLKTPTEAAAETQAETAQPTDLMTADEQPYGTRASAQARATREGSGDVVEVPGGWVVRPRPTTLESTTSDAQPAGTRGTTAADVLPALSTKQPEATDAKPTDSTPAAADVADGAVVPPGAEPARSDGAVAPLAADAEAGGSGAAEVPAPGSGEAVPVRGDGVGTDAVAAPRVIAQAGTTPKTATPLELRPNPDGTHTPYHEGYALNDFDSGEPIVIPVGTSNRDAIDLIKPSFGKSTKVFKVEADAESSIAPPAQAAPAVVASPPKLTNTPAPTADSSIEAPTTKVSPAPAPGRVNITPGTTVHASKKEAIAAGEASGLSYTATPHPEGQGLYNLTLDAERPGSPTVADVHRAADRQGIPWDNDAAFIAFTKEVTGKEHIDDLTGAERSELIRRLGEERKEAPTATADDHEARWTRMVELERRDVAKRAGLSATSTAFKRPWASIAPPIQAKLRAAMEPAAETNGTSPVSAEKPSLLEDAQHRYDVADDDEKAIIKPALDLLKPEAAEKTDADGKAWWKGLTKVGRERVLDAAGIKLPALVMWDHVTPENRVKLLAERGTELDDRERAIAAGDALKSRIAADVEKTGGKIIGQNIDGKDVKEDSRGVRTVDGQTEAVPMVPTRGPNGSVVMAIGKPEHKGVYLTAAEHAAANPAPAAAPAPTATPAEEDLDAKFERMLREKVAKREADAAAKATPKTWPGKHWDEITPARRKAMLEAAGYTDADQVRVLSNTKWTGLTDPVRKALAPNKKPVTPQIEGAGGPGVKYVLPSFVTANQAKKPRTATQAAASAAVNTAKGVAAGLDGLAKLFGGDGKLGSGLSFDEQTYAKAKPYFIQALGDLKAAAADIDEAMSKVIDALLDMMSPLGVKRMQPYAVRFIADVRDGKIDLTAGDNTATTTAKEATDGQSQPGAQGADALGGVAAGEGEAAASGGQTERGDSGSGVTGPEGDTRSDEPGVSGTRSGGSGSTSVRAPATGTGRGGRSGGKGRTGKAGSRAPGNDAGVLETGPAGDAREDLTPATEPVSVPNLPAVNFRITEDVRLGKGGEVEKFNDNVAAITTLKAIEAEGRRATPAEQRLLARYVGWGGLANSFPTKDKDGNEIFKPDWEKRGKALAELLTPKEYQLARRSTLDSHYTSQDVVTAMWAGARRLGFAGGTVLESSMGSGNFLGLMPDALVGQTRFVGVEFDSLTARLATLLYPQETVLNAGFQAVPLADGSFDLVIGNPPFGDQSLRFQFKPALNGASIHNQFIRGALDALKPGGISVQVVSRYLMDKIDKSDRIALAKTARLIGAVRLPDTAFKENARTQVVTDILFLQRLTASEEAHMAKVFAAAAQKPIAKNPAAERERWLLADQVPSWVNTVKVPDPLGGEAMVVNSHFDQNPHMVLGTLERSGSMQYGGDITVRPNKDTDIATELHVALGRLPQGIAAQTPDAIAASLERFKSMSDSLRIALSGQENGSIVLDADKKLQQVVERETASGAFELARRELTPASPWSEQLLQTNEGKWYSLNVQKDAASKPLKILDNEGKPTKYNLVVRKDYASEADISPGLLLGDARYERLVKLVGLRDLFVKQINLETEDAAPFKMEGNRKLLAAAYKAFTDAHGWISEPANSALVDNMPDGALVQSLELDYTPAISALRAKALGKTSRGATATPAPILTRRVIPKYEPPGKAASAADALQISLSEFGSVNLERMAALLGKTEDEVTAALFGDMDKPLIFKDPETQRWETRNVYLSGQVRRKLLAARSAGLQKNTAALEAVQPEAWGAENVTALVGSTWVPPQYYADFFQHMTGQKPHVSFGALTNTFAVRMPAASAKALNDQWGSDGMRVEEIITNMLNTAPIRVYDQTDDGPRVNQELSALAQLKATQIATEFSDWVFADSTRRDALVGVFNEKFNTRVGRQHDGSHLELPGKVPDAILRMRRHQKNAIWRGISERFVLYDHVVGSGKTFTAIARAMERRRMGLAKKPMIVVPNHMVPEWTNSVYRLYPGAKVLSIGKADLAKKRRRRAFAKIASGDWDMVIMPHSSFGFIGIAQETEERYLEGELVMAETAIKEAWEASGEAVGQFRKPQTVKQAERLRDKMQARMDRIKGRAKADRLLTFEQLGVDDLTVDEAHEFKNLFYSSKLTDVKGMGNASGSQKAFDLYSKVRVLRESPTGAVAFLTGTPISNSAVEMYNMMRYLAADELKELGLEHFDAFRAQFVSTDPGWEPNETGRLKEVNRLGRTWSNMRSLMDLYYSFTDSVGNDDIKLAYAEDNAGAQFPIPKVKGGDRRSIIVQPTRAQVVELEEVIEGFDDLPGITDPYERNIERLRLMDRARKVSLDVRASKPQSKSDEKGGKLDVLSGEVKRLYDAWTADRGTQLIFLDRSVPKSQGDNALLKEYDALVAARDAAIAADDEDALRKAMDALAESNPDEMEAMRVAQAGGWNAYQQIKDNLIALGIPADEIRFIQEANNDAQKQALFDAVNLGEVRVLIGSTQRMGAGTNVQQRLIGLHHADVTWKPSDIEQREGRIIRQGNKLLGKYGIDKFEVEILAYATERTIDAKMWNLNSAKLRTINGIRKYDGAFTMEFEDQESVSMAELAALASGDPLLMERVKLTSEIDKLELLERQNRRKNYGTDSSINSAERDIKELPARITAIKARAHEMGTAWLALHSKAVDRRVTVEGEEFTTMVSANAAVEKAVELQRAGNEHARYSVTVNGKKFTNKADYLAAIHAGFGDSAPFETVIGGQTYTTRTDAQREIARLAHEAAEAMTGNDADIALGTFAGLKLEGIVTKRVIYGGQATQYQVELTVLGADGKSLTTGVTDYRDSTDFTTAGLAGAVQQLDLSPTNATWTAQQWEGQLARAKAELPDLLKRKNQAFPQQAELDAKRERLEVVTRELAHGPAVVVSARDERDDEADLWDMANPTGAPNVPGVRYQSRSPLENRKASDPLPRVFANFDSLGKNTGTAGQGMRDAESKLNIRIGRAPMRDATLSDFAISAVDLATGNVVYNPAFKIPRGEWAQVMAEEVMHAVDRVGPNRAMSGTSERLAVGRGDIALEAQAVFESGRGLADFLAYPLEPKYGFGPKRIQAELFARLAVIYHGDQALMQRELPIAYEAYHALFQRTLLGPESSVLTDVRRADPQRSGQGGGRERAVSGPDGSSRQGDGRAGTDHGLDALRDRIARIFQADRQGGVVKGAFETRTGPQPVEPTRSAWLDPTNRLQFAPGAWLSAALADKAGPLLAKIGMKPMSTALRHQLRAMNLEVQRAQQTAVGVVKEMAAFTPDEADMVSDIIEQELAAGVTPPAEAVAMAAVMSQVMTAQSEELVSLGMLSEAAAARWDGKYLPRFYRSKLRKQAGDAWADAVNRLRGRTSTLKGIRGNHLKMRGLPLTIAAGELDDYLALGGWEIRDEGYVPGESPQVQIWRDWTREERDARGEIRDAKFRFVMGYMQTQRDLALGRMFAAMAADPEQSARLKPEGKDWVPVPRTIVEGTGVNRYGKLAGRYVPAETLSHLSQIEEASSEFFTAYRKAMGIWKEGKTALNPVSHMNNTVGNVIQAMLAGVGLHRADKYVVAVKDFMWKSPMVKEATDAGLFLGSMSSTELTDSLPKELRDLVARQDSTTARGAKLVYDIITLGLRRPLGAMYGAEDSFFRYLIYKDARGRGMAPNEAVDWAQKFIFTYDDLPRGARRVRDFGIPFFAYTYKQIPLMVDTALRHPVRFGTAAALIYAANAAAYALAFGGGGDDDDEWYERLRKYAVDPAYRKAADAHRDEEQAHLPPWQRGLTAMGTTKTIRLGRDALTKLPLFVDIANMIPGGNVNEATPHVPGALWWPQALTPGHPLFSLVTGLLANKDLWSGKDLVDSNDTTAESAAKRAEWAWKLVAPAVAPGNAHWERAMNTWAGMNGGELPLWIPESISEDYTGIGKNGLPTQPIYSVLNTVGIKVAPQDLDKSERIDEYMKGKMLTDIRGELMKLRRQANEGVIKESVFQKKLEQARQKIGNVREGLTVDGMDK